MMFLPPDLSKVSDSRLALMDAATERALKREIDRVSERDPAFRRALRQALAVEDEVERRKAI